MMIPKLGTGGRGFRLNPDQLLKKVIQGRLISLQLSSASGAGWLARAYPERNESPQGELVLQISRRWRENARRGWAVNKILWMKDVWTTLSGLQGLARCM
jgi:hypothetical protein